LPNGTDRGFTPAQALQEPQDFKVPQLRGTYQKMRFTNAPGAQSPLGFGLVHDGSDPSLFAFLSRPVFGPLSIDPVQKRNISAFVQCLDTGMAPAVGYGRTIASNNVVNAGVTGDWSMLEAQAAGGTNIDLIVKGIVDGERRGYVYQPASNNYRPDKQGLPAVTRAELIARVQNGDAITILGVPPGAGTRLGIKRNPSGLLDGDTPRPPLRLVRSVANSIVAWPTNASGFVLETTTVLPATNWTAETSLRGMVGNEFTVTNTPAESSRFFRLKEL
jgi:hypothetical protein